jgi:hypothetical protein
VALDGRACESLVNDKGTIDAMNDDKHTTGSLVVNGWGEQPHAGVNASLLLVSMGLLTQEPSLTRLFSYTVWYHPAYLTASVALLGFGASGAVVAARPRMFERHGDGRLIGLIVATASRTIAQLLVLVRYPLEVSGLTTAPASFFAGPTERIDGPHVPMAVSPTERADRSRR